MTLWKESAVPLQLKFPFCTHRPVQEDYVDYDQEEVEQGYEDTSETREDIEKSMFVF